MLYIRLIFLNIRGLPRFLRGYEKKLECVRVRRRSKGQAKIPKNFFSFFCVNFKNSSSVHKRPKWLKKIFWPKNFQNLIYWEGVPKKIFFSFFGVNIQNSSSVQLSSKMTKKNFLTQKFSKNAILCMWYWKMQRRAVSQFLASIVSTRSEIGHFRQFAP